MENQNCDKQLIFNVNPSGLKVMRPCSLNMLAESIPHQTATDKCHSKTFRT